MRINEPLLDEHLAAENAHDLDRIMATYGASPLILLNGKRVEGHDAIREFHRSFGFGNAGRYIDVHVAERHRYRTDDAIIIEQTLSGTAKDGRHFEAPVCTVYVFDSDGKLAAEHVYMDRAALS